MLWFLIAIFILKYIAFLSGLYYFPRLVSPNLFLITYPLGALLPLITVLILNKYYLQRNMSDYRVSFSLGNPIYILVAVAYPFAVIGLAIPIAFLVGVSVDWSLSEFFKIAEILAKAFNLSLSDIINLAII